MGRGGAVIAMAALTGAALLLVFPIILWWLRERWESFLAFENDVFDVDFGDVRGCP